MLGPVQAVSTAASLLVRPVVCGLLLHRGAVWLDRRITGAFGAIRMLKSGDLRKQLEALALIVARALSNERFRQQFSR